MRRTGEIRVVGDVEYEAVLEIIRDLIGLAFSVGVMGFIVFRAGGWM